MAIEPQTSLRRHPAIAQQVGLVIADYALLEMRMCLIYAAICPRQGGDAIDAFYDLRSIRRREELVLTELESIITPDRFGALKRLWKRFKAAANRRTEIAHCAFLDRHGSPMRLRLAGTTPSLEKLDTEIFDRTFTQYRKLGQDLQNFLIFSGQLHPAILEKFQSSVLAPLLRLSEVSMTSAQGQKPPEVSEREESLKRLGLEHLIPEERIVLTIHVSSFPPS